MIYIDPPYNTGNDFIYPDDYAESLKTYLEYTGQVDEEGRKFSTNTDTDGRFHSKWLNMMYPRLYLARNLLRDDGVIFISIDDGEVRNLRALCDDIFGEENFVSHRYIHQRAKRADGQAPSCRPGHDYLVVRSPEHFPLASSVAAATTGSPEGSATQSMASQSIVDERCLAPTAVWRFDRTADDRRRFDEELLESRTRPRWPRSAAQIAIWPALSSEPTPDRKHAVCLNDPRRPRRPRSSIRSSKHSTEEREARPTWRLSSTVSSTIPKPVDSVERQLRTGYRVMGVTWFSTSSLALARRLTPFLT